MGEQDPSDRRPMGRSAHLMSATSGQRSSDGSGITKRDGEDESRPVTGRGRIVASKEMKLTECLHALCPLPTFAFTFPFTAPVKMRMKFCFDANSGKRIISSDTILQRYEDNNFLRKCAKNTHDN